MRWFIAIGIGIHTSNGAAIVARSGGLPHWAQTSALMLGLIIGTWAIISHYDITEKSA